VSAPLRVVLDTDIGSNPDDALALALALHSPELELAAVTTVGAEPVYRARIAARMLELAGRAQIPVHAGCGVPLLGGEGFCWFGHEGEGLLEPTEEPPFAREHAVDALRALLHRHDALHIAALGPLTNLAAVLILEPELVSRIGSITVVGGWLHASASAQGAGYNLDADPHAAQRVFASGAPLRLLTPDATLKAWLRPRELARLREHSADPLLAALADAVELWVPVQRALYAQRGLHLAEDNCAFLHDPLALASLYAPELCRFETLELEYDAASGRTLERSESGAATRPVQCAIAADAARLREYLVQRLVF
jgi:purine nucleosidase